MDLSIHFIVSVILTIILYPVLGIHALWILVGGFLIDTDHYIYYVITTKDPSIKKAYTSHINRKYTKNNDYQLHIFHTIEFWSIMILGAITFYYTNQTFLFYMTAITFTGMILHLILDFIDSIRQRRFNERAISAIEWTKRRTS